MTSQTKFYLGHLIYRIVTIGGMFLIPLLITNQYQQARTTKMVENIKAMPTTEWFKYEKIEPTKKEFQYGENIYLRSTREVNESPPYTTLDEMLFTFTEYLMCDFNDGYGDRRVDPVSKSEGIRVKGGFMTTPPWKRLGPKPYYIPSTCHIHSRICIEVQGIDKCQFIESSLFSIQ